MLLFLTHVVFVYTVPVCFRRNCDSTPDQLMIFARKKDLRLRRLDTEDQSYDMVLPVDGIKSAVALAWDSNSDSIFWSDVENDLISRAFLNGSKQQPVIANNLGKLG